MATAVHWGEARAAAYERITTGRQPSVTEELLAELRSNVDWAVPVARSLAARGTGLKAPDATAGYRVHGQGGEVDTLFTELRGEPPRERETLDAEVPPEGLAERWNLARRRLRQRVNGLAIGHVVGEVSRASLARPDLSGSGDVRYVAETILGLTRDDVGNLVDADERVAVAHYAALLGETRRLQAQNSPWLNDFMREQFATLRAPASTPDGAPPRLGWRNVATAFREMIRNPRSRTWAAHLIADEGKRQAALNLVNVNAVLDGHAFLTARDIASQAARDPRGRALRDVADRHAARLEPRGGFRGFLDRCSGRAAVNRQFLQGAAFVRSAQAVDPDIMTTFLGEDGREHVMSTADVTTNRGHEWARRMSAPPGASAPRR